MKKELEAIREKAAAELDKAKDPKVLEELRIKYLGKKGELTSILKQMGKLSAEERPVIGQLANEVRSFIEQDMEKRAALIKEAELERKLERETLDVTPVSYTHLLGSLFILLIKFLASYVVLRGSLGSSPKLIDNAWFT